MEASVSEFLTRQPRFPAPLLAIPFKINSQYQLIPARPSVFAKEPSGSLEINPESILIQNKLCIGPTPILLYN